MKKRSGQKSELRHTEDSFLGGKMGARQSKRSVDITTTPKKEGLPAEGGVGDAAAPGDGKLERIEETDTKPTTNGITPHTETVEEKKDEATEKVSYWFSNGKSEILTLCGGKLNQIKLQSNNSKWQRKRHRSR